MTRTLTVILLVIISGIIGNRRDVTNIDQLRYKLLQLKDEFKNIEISRDNGPGIETYLRLIQLYEEFCAELDDAWRIKSKHILISRNSLPLWQMVQDKMTYIDELYETFRQRLNGVNEKRLPFDDKQWMNFAKTVLEDPNLSVPSAMETITDTAEFFFTSSHEDQEAAFQICCSKQSPQQVLFNFYNIFELTGIKGSAIMQFSYTFLGFHNNGTFSDEFIKTDRKYNLRTNQTLRAVTTAIAVAPREFWRCEPRVHKEDSTYTELKEFIQGYIVNEVDLNPTQSCTQNCGFYRDAEVHGCFKDQFCSQQRRCNGRVRNCQYIEADMWICPSETKSSRYRYIKYENGRVFGNKETCHRQPISVNSWYRMLVHCSYCICYCDDNNESSDRYFSLKEATSNVEKNRVVTGIKLTKVNKVIHLQIQEGELLPRGEILEESVQWKDVDNFTVMDRNMQNGKDYHSLDWENRALDLDDLVAPKFHVLTGVRFKLIDTHLHLDIRVTPFNFTTGLLIEKSAWLNDDINDSKYPAAVKKAKTELKLMGADVPTRLKTPALPDSKSNQYLKFGPTDLEKDAAQTTIPFLDVQPVTTNPPFPLSGAGIFHKGSDGSGGFVALRVITYDISNHLNIDVSPPLPVIGVNETPTLL